MHMLKKIFCASRIPALTSACREPSLPRQIPPWRTGYWQEWRETPGITFPLRPPCFRVSAGRKSDGGGRGGGHENLPTSTGKQRKNIHIAWLHNKWCYEHLRSVTVTNLSSQWAIICATAELLRSSNSPITFNAFVQQAQIWGSSYFPGTHSHCLYSSQVIPPWQWLLWTCRAVIGWVTGPLATSRGLAHYQ